MILFHFHLINFFLYCICHLMKLVIPSFGLFLYYVLLDKYIIIYYNKLNTHLYCRLSDCNSFARNGFYFFDYYYSYMYILTFEWVELIPGRLDICYNKQCVRCCSLLHKLYTTSVKYSTHSGASRGPMA